MFNEFQRNGLVNVAPSVESASKEALMPWAMTYLREYKQRKAWYFFEDENPDETLPVVDVQLSDEQVQRLEAMLADNPDELPIWELIEERGDKELMYAIMGAESLDDGYVILPDSYGDRHYRYRFTVMVFPALGEVPVKYACDIVLTDEEYCRLLVAMKVDREYFTFNHLATLDAELYATITKKLLCSLQTPTYAHEFAVWCDEAMEDVKAAELLEQPEDASDEVTAPAFNEAVFATEAKEFLYGHLSLDAYVDAHRDVPRDEKMDELRRCFFEKQLGDYQGGKLSFDEAYDALMEFVKML